MTFEQNLLNFVL